MSKNSDRVCLKGQLNTDAVGEETKNRALEPASFRKEIIVNQSQRKAKSQNGICARFWFDRRGHKAKRSDARFIIGSAEALPILCVSDFVSSRERERETPVTSSISR